MKINFYFWSEVLPQCILQLFSKKTFSSSGLQLRGFQSYPSSTSTFTTLIACINSQVASAHLARPWLYFHSWDFGAALPSYSTYTSLLPTSSGLSPVDCLDKLVLNLNSDTLHQPATAYSNNSYSHLGAHKQTGTSGSPIIYHKSCTPFSNPSNGSTASISPTTGNNVVFLLSIIIDTVACVSEDLLIENVEGSMCMVEDEKQLQKLNTSLTHLFWSSIGGSQCWISTSWGGTHFAFFSIPLVCFWSPLTPFLFSKIIALLLPIPIWNHGLSNV